MSAALAFNGLNTVNIIWVFCTKQADKHTNTIPKVTRLLTYQMEEEKFKDLWIKDQSNWVHADYISVPVVEIYETVPGYSPAAMKAFFHMKYLLCNLWKRRVSKLPETKSCKYGTQAYILKQVFSGIMC